MSDLQELTNELMLNLYFSYESHELRKKLSTDNNIFMLKFVFHSDDWTGM